MGGVLSGRRFRAPTGDQTRPTTDRVREAVGSVLESRAALHDAVVLDLFSGTGAYAFEALSRGGARAVLVEKDSKVSELSRKNAAGLGLGTRVETVVCDLLREGQAATGRIARALGGAQATLVFCDPPYELVDRLPACFEALLAANLIAPDAFVVVEAATRNPPPQLPLVSISSYRYGDTQIWLARVPSLSSEPPAPEDL